VVRPNRKGFTLIEILIVVIILGILAAIVIPQFTNASKDAKQSALVTMVQSMRSQIALFKLQHNDYLPGSAPLNGAFSGATFWNQMTLFSNVTGQTQATKDTTTGFDKGPYMQSIPKNPLCPTSTLSSDLVVATMNGTDPDPHTAVVGFLYDYGTNGNGSGKIWGTGTDGKAPVVQ